jgi:hypothetical protein
VIAARAAGTTLQAEERRTRIAKSLREGATSQPRQGIAMQPFKRLVEPIDHAFANAGDDTKRNHLDFTRSESPDLEDDITVNETVGGLNNLSSASSKCSTPRAEHCKAGSPTLQKKTRPPGIRNHEELMKHVSIEHREDVEVKKEISAPASAGVRQGASASVEDASVSSAWRRYAESLSVSEERVQTTRDSGGRVSKNERGTIPSTTPSTTLSTLMICNLNNNMKPEVFMDYLNEIGLSGTYDFLYMPQIQHHVRSNQQQLMVNFKNPMEPSELRSALSRGTLQNEERLSVMPAHHQGVFKNLAQLVQSDAYDPTRRSNRFGKLWVQINGVLKAMDVPTAHLIYQISQ